VKKAFAFSDADFSLWLESENEWGVRLKARPMRSDVPVSDTGTFRMEGRFQRASSLRGTPVNLKIDFARGQFGQITALIYGRDRGWRGGVTSTASLAGTPASLAVTIDAQVDDFRRYDIALGEAMRLSVHCTGTYSSPDDSIRDIQCQSPVRPGMVLVRGNVVGWAGEAYGLGISAEQIPLDRVVALARHTKKDLPDDLTATGSADMVFTVRRDTGASPVWAGGGRTTHFALQSKVLKEDLELGEVELSIPRASDQGRRKHLRTPAKPGTSDAALRVIVKPFSMPLGAASPATASGYFDLEHYRVRLSGDAEMTRLLSIAKATGMGAPAIGLAGPAQLEIEIAGGWTGFAPPVPSGKIQLHDATAELQGVGEPLQLASAAATLADQSVTISSFAAEFKDGLSISGSANFPLRCVSAESCVLHFDLHTPEISLARANQLMNPSYQSRPWYHLLAIGQRDENALLKVRAVGRVSAGRMLIGELLASNFVSTVEMNSGKLSLKEIRADVLGGHHAGNWDGDFTSTPPKYFGSGTVTKIAMAQVAGLMHDPWATGTMDGEYTLGIAGLSAAALRDSASGSASFKWTGGSLRHVTLETKNTPLAFSSFGGQLALQNGTISCQGCKLQSSSDSFDVMGSATFSRTVDVHLENPAHGASYVISGPLERPDIVTVPTPSSEAKAR
jgi:hypothetical protein